MSENLLPMKPRTSMGWGQDLHSGVFFFFEKKKKIKDGRESVNMNEEMQTDGGGWAGGVREWDAPHSQSQIQLMPLRGVDQVMTWGLLD